MSISALKNSYKQKCNDNMIVPWSFSRWVWLYRTDITTQCDYSKWGANSLIVISLLQCAISSDRVSSFLPLVPPTVLLASVSLRKTPSISRKPVVGSGRGRPPWDAHIPEYSALFLLGWRKKRCSIYAKSSVTAERGRYGGESRRSGEPEWVSGYFWSFPRWLRPGFECRILLIDWQLKQGVLGFTEGGRLVPKVLLLLFC